ncbi:hypothetical protein DENIS_4603 [Desulfonema ishimotonii]|uniref:Phasin domain-containing protein n=1 Tax=Desulfonema ishimotonii TaxID=45657 RepID=A0A401G3A6_9BACT|nr:hypothetical protein [Desulfonema ishimotonii]GBC63605.1 hypothetical protein DENIS_4603 [Desulfonema ishimotonii]
MEAGKIATQTITFQKTFFNSSFNAVCAIQDQTEKVGETFLNQMTWLPEEGHKSFKDSIEMYKKARNNFKKAVDDGFEKFEQIFAGKEGH